MARASRILLVTAASAALAVALLATVALAAAPSGGTGVRGSASATGSAAPTHSVTSTASAEDNGARAQTGYALDFTLPTYGKAGCLVCHGDANLVISKGAGNRTFWIDQRRYVASAHGTILCTGCHVDYGYKAPHKPSTDYRTTAKQACKGCHADQFRDYSLGAHAVRPTEGGRPDPKAASKPLCGDCHGSHDMPKLKDDPAGQAALHASGGEMCGRKGCHAEFWDNYDDYYHGAAYKAGAQDAPACWDCHGAHTVLATKNKLSPTNVTQLKTTCSGPPAPGRQYTCHEGATAAYSTYTELIHGKKEVVGSNPVVKLLSGLTGAVGGLFGR